MKRQNSSLSFKSLSEVSSSDDESEKAKPKLDKEELRKYLKDSDEESSQDQISPNTTPKRPKKKNVKRLKTSPIEDSPIIKPMKVISKDPPKNYLVQGDNFKIFRKRQRNLVLIHSSIPKEKNINT